MSPLIEFKSVGLRNWSKKLLGPTVNTLRVRGKAGGNMSLSGALCKMKEKKKNKI